MLTERRQLSGALEDQEGTLQTLAAADAKTLVFNPVFKSNPDKHESNPARTGGSAQPQLIGKIPATVSFQVQIRGSGTATTDPDWIKYLKACGFASALLKSIPIGAVTGGPFQHGETITGGTSGATGRVIFNTATGTSPIYFVYLGTATFQSGETITGGTSGATAATSSTPSSAGRAYEPILENIISLSAGFNQDGYFEKIKGARGNAKLALTPGTVGTIDFEFSGVDAGQSAETFFEGVAYEETDPPAFKSGVVLIDSYEPMLQSLEFDVGAKLSQRDDPTDEKGILSYALTSRKITGTLVLEMVPAATYDFRTKYHAGTEFVLDITIGTTSGNKFRIYHPRAQIIDIDKSDKDGLVQVSIQYQANGSLEKNNDLAIVQL
ncbi:MAG: hypothetical protein PHG31_05000 [Candidatus Omnitrophica bacterium]|nr:hypothetical protein [Candidatus Omnitrophota bacterium]